MSPDLFSNGNAPMYLQPLYNNGFFAISNSLHLIWWERHCICSYIDDCSVGFEEVSAQNQLWLEFVCDMDINQFISNWVVLINIYGSWLLWQSVTLICGPVGDRFDRWRNRDMSPRHMVEPESMSALDACFLSKMTLRCGLLWSCIHEVDEFASWITRLLATILIGIYGKNHWLD